MLVQVFVVGCVLLIALVGVVLTLRLCYRRVRPGEALVICGSRGRMRVSFSGALVVPLVERAEKIDISLRTLDIVPQPAELVTTKDNERVTYRARFLLHIRETSEDVLHVAKTFGCDRASDPQKLEELLRPKLVAAVRQVAGEYALDDLLHGGDRIKDELMAEIGVDLMGFCLDDVVLDQLERAPGDPHQTPFR
jgi:uncharacterized membrane protein YqiK